MRRIIVVVVVICMLLCGCEQKQYEIQTFSYTEHCVEYTDQKVNIRDTQVQKKRTVRNPDDAVEIAKEYCLTSNMDTMVAYDPLTGVYCVTFLPVFQVDGNPVYYTDSQTVHVYVNKDGITLMTILVG